MRIEIFFFINEPKLRDLSHQFYEFQHFLGVFLAKVVCYILFTTHLLYTFYYYFLLFTSVRQGKIQQSVSSYCFWYGLIPVFACSDNTKLHLFPSI